MSTISNQVASNTKNLITENNKRGAALVRVYGSEHNATGYAGVGTFYLANDIDMCYISELKFKLIFEDEYADPSTSPESIQVPYGTKTWASIEDFIASYPLGSAIDTDNAYGAQSLIPGTCLLGSDSRYVPVEDLTQGDKVADKTGSKVNTISDNDCTDDSPTRGLNLN